MFVFKAKEKAKEKQMQAHGLTRRLTHTEEVRRKMRKRKGVDASFTRGIGIKAISQGFNVA